MIDLTSDEMLYLQTILERLQGKGEAEVDEIGDQSQPILDKLEKEIYR